MSPRTSSVTQPKISAKANKIQELRDALCQTFPERDDTIDALLVSLISKEPTLLLGPPGTAKSMLIRYICNAIGGKYFQWLMGKLTTPEELFGPPSLKGLEQDRYRRNTTGKLPEADIVFLDEVFKSSSAILNTLLTIMNEREFFNDGQGQKVPMITMFAASNELPQAEELAAMYDRFAIRIYVDYIQDDKNAEKLFTGLNQVAMPSISMQELVSYQAEAKAVKIPKTIVTSLITLRRGINEAGLHVSDRKWVQACGVLQAYAWLNGRSEVTEDDLEILNNVLWSDKEQIATVRKEVSKVGNSDNAEILKHKDAIAEAFRSIQSPGKGKKLETDQIIELWNKMKNSQDKLKKLADKPENKGNKKLEEALKDVVEKRRIVGEQHLGIL